MRRLTLAVLPSAFLAACQPSPPAGEEVNPLEGAWRITGFSFTQRDTSYTHTNPQAGLFLFTEGHYSMMWVSIDEPRPLVAGDVPLIGTLDPTDTEKVASWDTFIAQSGTYEATDSTIMYRPVAAKNANLMAAGGPLMDRYELVEDMLYLTFVPPWAPETEQRWTLTRIR